MPTKWQQFVEEKKYLTNVSAKTLEHYRYAHQAWGKLVPEDPTVITEAVLKKAVIAMQKSGVSAISVNTYIRPLNTYLRWLGTGLKVPRIIEPQLVPRTFTPDQIQKLLELRPRGVAARRVVLAVALIADTGLRIEETLRLESHDIDLESCLIRVRLGKGRKDRLVPMSIQLRKRIYLYTKGKTGLLFATRTLTCWSYRNSLRDLKLFCRRLNISGPKVSWHTIRHSFATNYIRQGGDVLMLQRILGHTSLQMTQRYVHLQTEDLRAVHDRRTMLR
jgi:site-specific recombinase XerD